MPLAAANTMGAINMHIMDIDGTHGISVLPQGRQGSPERNPFKCFLLKNPWGPWYLGRARAWARAWGWPGPGKVTDLTKLMTCQKIPGEPLLPKQNRLRQS